jgi:glycosyltransferase involved in cell wall biosynthesis
MQYPCIPGNAGLATAGYFLFREICARIRALHRRQRIDLVHAHSALPCGHAAQLISRDLDIPYVVTMHGLDAFCTRQVRGVFGIWCRRRTVKIFQEAKRVLCVSRKVEQQVTAGCPNAHTTVVYNGVNASLFSPAPAPTTGNTILCVGNLIPTKGQDVLLRAFAEVRKTVPDAALQFVGEGPEEPKLRQVAHQLGIADAVSFNGRKDRESIARDMRECALFVLPSSYEGLGCVYLEAMSSSKVVIGCRGQGIEEIVDRANGYLITPGDHRELAKTIAFLLQNRMARKEVELRARRTILGEYTLEHQAARLFQAYQESTR